MPLAQSTIHIVGGPTASGKSSYAMDLGRTCDGVIINCDSIQIYDDLKILTAQPDDDDLKTLPHRLYGDLHPNDVCSAGNWRELVIPVIEQVLANGQTPIICGGTGLYIKALMQGLSPMPGIPQDVRDAAVALQADMGNPAFHAMIAEHDPIMAARFHPYHTARLVRAWEVLQATGKSLATWQNMPREKPPAHWRFEVHKIMPERSVLRARCAERFKIMIEMGALDEVIAFNTRIKSGAVRADVPLTKAIGYKLFCQHLNGDLTLDEVKTLAITATQQYAKRQTTWFRNQL